MISVCSVVNRKRPMQKVRVRMAPSPTGSFHIGTARTALYNWLFARHHGGTFILRIEDTDRERSTEEAVRVILDSMGWLGLGWDEGPHFQSQRVDVYKNSAEKLLAAGKARLDDLGRPEKGKAVVFEVPQKDVVFDDLVKGTIRKAAKDLDPHIVLMRADGTPTYNFACVADDIDMAITHVIRGDDHVANTWKQLLVYEALEAKPPLFAHLPMIHNTRGRKLSKRDGAVAVTDYRRMGYLPEALANFLALLGWSPGDDTELMSREELTRRFDLDRVKSSPSQFDFEKFEWMNGRHIAGTSPEELASLVKPFIEEAGLRAPSDEWLSGLVRIQRERMRTLRDLAEAARYFFVEEVEPDGKARKLLARPGAAEALKAAREALAGLEPFEAPRIEAELRTLAESLSVGMGKVAQAVRAAVTGRAASPPIGETCELIGRKRCLARIDRALAALA